MANERGREGGPSDPGRPRGATEATEAATEATQEATEAARVAPGSLEGAARPASGAKSRPRRSPERPEEAIWLDFGSILGGFWLENRARNGCVDKLCATRVSKPFLVTFSSFFRRCSRTRFLADTQETLVFTVANACRPCSSLPWSTPAPQRSRAENARRFWSKKHGKNGPKTEKTPRKLTLRSFRADVGTFSLLGPILARFWLPRGTSGRSLGAFWLLRGALGGSLGAPRGVQEGSWASLGASWWPPGVVFGALGGRLGALRGAWGLLGSIWGRFWSILGPILVDFRVDFW